MAAHPGDGCGDRLVHLVAKGHHFGQVDLVAVGNSSSVGPDDSPAEGRIFVVVYVTLPASG